MRDKFPRLIFFFLGLFVLVLRGFATPGEVLSLEFEYTYSKQEIRDMLVPLYGNHGLPDILYEVDVYRVFFESRYPDGTPARAFGQFFLPRLPTSGNSVHQNPLSLYVFAPGSTGLLDNCRPSREHEAGIRWGLYRAHVMSHAAAGSLGMLPDYLGFHDPERHQYYMVARAEAAVLLDSIRAVHSVGEMLGYTHFHDSRNFLGGFSQGGHAVLAAADFQPLYAPELELHGVIGYGATPDPEALMLEFPSVAPMMIYTYSELYGVDLVDPGEILMPEFGEFLEDDVLSQCVGGMQAYYPDNPKYLYHPEFHKALLDDALEERFPGLAWVLAQNTTGFRAQNVDILLLQGSDDVVVFPETQQSYVQELQNRGLQVEYILFPDERHDTRQVGYDLVRLWIEQRISN